MSNPAPLISIPQNQVPPGGSAAWLTRNDGPRLRAARWLPTSPAKGTVVLLHGRTEFIEKFYEVIGELLARGFAVATVDWRGQGLSDRALSDPRKGHLTDAQEFFDDFDHFIAEWVLETLPEPYVLLGFSMGSVPGLRALVAYPDLFARAAFSAPMFGLRPGGIPEWFLRLVACGAKVALSEHYILGGGPVRQDSAPFETNGLTHDAKRYARLTAILDAEPKLSLGGPTIGWMDAALRGMDHIRQPAYLTAIDTPVLITSAARENLVSNVWHQRVADGLSDATLLTIPGAYHEILMEDDRFRAQFWTAFDAHVNNI